MRESQLLKAGRIADPSLDRRSGDDRREAYLLGYFEQGGIEKRSGVETRRKWDRRLHCVPALRYSKLQLRLGDLGLWEWNTVTNQFEVNERWLSMLGLDPRGPMPTIHMWNALVHPDDMPKWDLLVNDVIFNPSGSEFEVEIRARHRVGHFVWILDKGAVVERAADGSPLRVVGTHMDITERKRAEEELRDREERQRRIVRASNDAFLLRSKEIVTYANPAALKLFRANRPGDLIGKRYLDLVHPEDRALIAERAKRAIGEDWIASPREHRILALDGRVVHVESTGVLVKHLGETQIFAVFRDITERKRAEGAMRKREENYRRIVETSPDGIAFLDEKYQFRVVNDAYERFSGVKREKMIGLTVAECLGEQTFQTQVKQQFDKCLQGETVTYQEWFDYPALGRRFVAITYFPYRDARNHIAGVVINTRDVTERKQAEVEKDKLDAQNRQLQKAESLSRMAGAIAHHFNNQLGAVMGNLEMAMVDLPWGAEPVERLTEAMQAARRAAEVSGLMLTYLGQTRGKREPLDLSEICRRSLPMLQAAMPKDVTLETDLPSPGPTISANAIHLQKVLTNLCTNAWEAVGDGRGFIYLMVKAVPAADIPGAPRFPLDWQPQGSTYACLEVADAGCGIAGQDIEKLFDPFFSTKFTGRGLGLSEALGIVRTHDGLITVQSEPGHGSVFRVFFPVLAEAVPRPSEKVADAQESEGGGTVLLVEDMYIMRTIAKKMLELLGFSVLEARDGVEAMEVFRQHQDEIRFVLCDLTLPRMDGWQTLAALRELSPGVPMILTSGHNAAQGRVGDHLKFPEAFLSKPYGFKELFDAIARALKHKK
jgi:PAS domain S-box-containing protein